MKEIAKGDVMFRTRKITNASTAGWDWLRPARSSDLFCLPHRLRRSTQLRGTSAPHPNPPAIHAAKSAPVTTRDPLARVLYGGGETSAEIFYMSAWWNG